MGRAQRRKGHDFERWVVRYSRDAFAPYDVRRGLQTQHTSGTPTPDVYWPDPLWVECKKGKQTNVKAALRQASGEAPAGYWPVAVCQDDRQPATVTMWLADFLDLAGQWWVLNRK